MGAVGFDGHRRHALVVACSEFEDATLNRLAAPPRDAQALARVLEDPAIGGFDVTTLTNAPSFTIAERIERFFDERRRDDFLLLYFSGHGIKNADGNLYFAAVNTRTDRLRSTAVPAGFVHDVMQASRSRRQVLVLDCCHSGAFVRGLTAKAGGRMGVGEQFAGHGRVVLTASDAVQYAFEGGEVTGAGAGSVFTRELVDGLRTGAADLDRDGLVAVDELYDYLHERVTAVSGQQRPAMWAFDIRGELVLARSPRPATPEPGPAADGPPREERPLVVEPRPAPDGPPRQERPPVVEPRPAADGPPPVERGPSRWRRARRLAVAHAVSPAGRLLGAMLALVLLVGVSATVVATWSAAEPESPPEPAGNTGPDPGASPSPAVVGPERAPIAFVSDRAGSNDVFVVDGLHGRPRNLTRSDADDRQPAWSPDRSRIAFASDRADRRFAIYLMDADGQGVTALTDGGAYGDYDPAWSPDGSTVAFSRRGEQGVHDLYVVDVDGGDPVRLTDAGGSDQRPAWSPDGTRLAFHSTRDGALDIYVMAVDGGGLTNLTRDPAADFHPSWSPDGTAIAFASNRTGVRDVFVVDVDGGSPRNVTDSPANDWEPGWSPDGSMLAFESDRDGHSAIYVIDAEGSGLTRVAGDQSGADPAW